MKENPNQDSSANDNLFDQDPIQKFPQEQKSTSQKIFKVVSITLLILLAIISIIACIVGVIGGLTGMFALGVIILNPLAAYTMSSLTVTLAALFYYAPVMFALTSLGLTTIGAGVATVAGVGAFTLSNEANIYLLELKTVIQNDSSSNLVEVQKFLEKHRFDYTALFDSRIIRAAIDKNYPPLLEFLCKAKDQMNFDPKDIEYAITNQKPQMLQILLTHLSPQETQTLNRYIELAKEVKNKEMIDIITVAQNKFTKSLGLSPLPSPQSPNNTIDEDNKVANNGANYLKEAHNLLIGDDQDAEIASRAHTPILGAKLGKEKTISK